MKIFAFFLPIPFPVVIYKETLPIQKSTPIHEENIFDLINRGNLKAVHSSIEKGTSINSKNYKDQTLLHYAVCHNQIEIAKLLIHLGANLYAIDNQGKKVIDVIYDRHQEEVLLEKFFTTQIEQESAINQQVDELGATSSHEDI